ncbi:MAG: tRNA (guanosine(46)-N7)-methyltransferase TrmB [Mariprofundaceae bacterium]
MRLPGLLRDEFLQHELRTYGRKNGFITKGQALRMERLFPAVSLPAETLLDVASFKQPGSLVMEIGIGNGEFLECLARTHTEWNLIGIEIYLPGIAKAISRLEASFSLERVRLSQNPAQYVLEKQIGPDCLHGIYINHPDPWPKTRHAGRRLIQVDFAKLLASRLEANGFLKLATDRPDLAEWMREILDNTEGLQNKGDETGFVTREENRLQTKFEQRGLKEGRKSQFLHYVKEGICV